MSALVFARGILLCHSFVFVASRHTCPVQAPDSQWLAPPFLHEGERLATPGMNNLHAAGPKSRGTVHVTGPKKPIVFTLAQGHTTDFNFRPVIVRTPSY